MCSTCSTSSRELKSHQDGYGPMISQLSKSVVFRILQQQNTASYLKMWGEFIWPLFAHFTSKLEEALLWIMESYFGQKQQFEVKTSQWWICFLQTHIFWLLKMLTDGLEWCGLLWCFISCLDSHSDGTHSLQSIHWWKSAIMLHFSKSDEETNASTSAILFCILQIFTIFSRKMCTTNICRHIFRFWDRLKEKC